EPESGALMARRAVAAVVSDGVRQGIAYANEAIQAPAGIGREAVVRSLSGLSISAGAFVFACGAWLPKLFPRLLGDRIYPTRQEIFYFAPPPGDSRFAPSRL